MAEQIGHNVVDRPESTSGSPLVDVAANSTTSQSAPSGLQQSSTPTTAHSSNHAIPVSSKIANEPATSANASAPTQAGSGAAAHAAEPSAGDAAQHAALNPASTAAISAGEHPGPAQGDLANGVHDEANPGDDRSTADVSVDVSVTSDTDNSKADASDKQDRPNHVRTNSVKKPTAFSKVTATKSFMNKITPSAPAAPKLGDKREYKKELIRHRTAD